MARRRSDRGRRRGGAPRGRHLRAARRGGHGHRAWPGSGASPARRCGACRRSASSPAGRCTSGCAPAISAFSRRQSNALFLVVLVPTVVMTWLIDEARAGHHQTWVPYEPNKLSALTLAIIAPPGWSTGVAGILMFIGSALVRHLTWPDAVRPRVSAGEPFGIIAYGVFALVVLGFKQRGINAARRSSTTRAPRRWRSSASRGSRWRCAISPTRPCRRWSWSDSGCSPRDPQLGVQTNEWDARWNGSGASTTSSPRTSRPSSGTTTDRPSSVRS